MSDAPPLKSQRPYLLRAMHEWIVDNAQTPHVIVDATQPGVAVPISFVQEGKIVLNLSMEAANGLALGNERVEFQGRFGGVVHEVCVPVGAILCIYARETGQGMVFGEPEPPPAADPSPPSPPPPADPPRRGKAALKVL
jgi:stringent starvation protein B